MAGDLGRPAIQLFGGAPTAAAEIAGPSGFSKAVAAAIARARPVMTCLSPTESRLTWIERALPDLRRVARSMGRPTPAADPEDHVQATVLEVLRAPTRVPRTDERGFHRWLIAVLRNNVRDDARRRLITTLPPDALDAVATPAREAPPRLASAAEVRCDLERAVAALPPVQRRVVCSCLLAGACRREVAATLGRSEDAVQALLARAKRKLATSLWGGGAGADASTRRATGRAADSEARAAAPRPS
ncbi:MAG: sigma-70 family RNA polymerase sigma factor [Planctomycetota bacterium]